MQNELCTKDSTVIPKDSYGLTPPHWPGPLPTSVTSLEECARYVILRLEEHPQEHEDALDDGFVICDIQTVARKLDVWKQMFPRVRPFFALKCNPDPTVATILAQNGAGFDCASIPEIQLALKLVSCDDIIYANPQRAESDLAKALELGIRYLTFDGSEELHKTALLSKKPDITPQMILRILVPDKDATVPLGDKFGATLDAIPDLVETAKQLGLPIVGVSFHCGSGNHDPQAYQCALELAAKACDEIQRCGFPSCEIVDIGGGYPGRDRLGGEVGRFAGVTQDESELEKVESVAAKSADAIALAIEPLLAPLFPANISIIAEPGRYFVESSFALCSRVYKVKEVNGRRLCHIGHGVQGLFKDRILCNEVYEPLALSTDREMTATTFPTSVLGPSGEDYDVIVDEILLPALKEGDWLVFDRMGAYTMSIAFRRSLPPVYYVRSCDKR